VSRLCQTYKELELLNDKAYCVTSQSALCGSAACSAEILAFSEEETIQGLFFFLNCTQIIRFSIGFIPTECVVTFQLLWQVHQDVQEFVFNGTTILLPEIVGLFQSGDSGVVQLHEELEALCIDINLSKVPFHIVEYKFDVKCIYLQMNSTKLRFTELMGQGDEEDDANLTRGQMLLQGLNGLFEKIESDFIEWTTRAKLEDNSLQSNLLIEAREKVVSSYLLPYCCHRTDDVLFGCPRIQSYSARSLIMYYSLSD